MFSTRIKPDYSVGYPSNVTLPSNIKEPLIKAPLKSHAIET